MLPVQGACVESLVRELEPTCMHAPSKTGRWQAGRVGDERERGREREREKKQGAVVRVMQKGL